VSLVPIQYLPVAQGLKFSGSHQEFFGKVYHIIFPQFFLKISKLRGFK
jgi:hypothetical protein